MSIIKSEFKLENFKLSCDDPYLMLSSRWQQPHTPSRWYLGLRVLLALYHTSWVIFLFISNGGVQSPFATKLYFFIYMTNWSYMVLTFFNVIWAINVVRAYIKYDKEGYLPTTMGLALKLQWVFQNMTYMPAMVVTLIYWTALYSPGLPISPSNAEAHIMNSIFVVLDIVVSASPVRLLHVYQPILYLAAYVLFSLVYYYAGGTTSSGSHYIYSVLDWEKPGSTLVFLAIGFVGTICLQVFVWLLFVTREKLYVYSVRRSTGGHFELA